MRVSTSMIFQGLTDKLANNAADMAQLQSQIATGNNYATPSDAPISSDVSKRSRVD